ncbi:MAG: hypothetical protein ABI113_00040 [Mucilaginibacter sp.]
MTNIVCLPIFFRKPGIYRQYRTYSIGVCNYTSTLGAFLVPNHISDTLYVLSALLLLVLIIDY